MTNQNLRLLTSGLVLTLLFGSTMIASSSARTTVVQNCTQVAVNLDSREATQSEIELQIRQQLGRCGISATEREIQAGAQNTLNLVDDSKDPEKGVIYVHTDRYTICASWGQDKDYCKTH
jgi:hypothetical protein